MPTTLDMPLLVRDAGASGPDVVQFGPSTIDLPVVARQAVAFGPTITRPAAVLAPGVATPPDITVELWDDTNSTQLDADVGGILGTREWDDDPLDLGQAQLAVPTRHSAEVAAADELAADRVLRFRLHDQPAFAGLIRRSMTIETAKLPGDRRRTVYADDLRCILDDAGIRPAAGTLPSPLRTFNWGSPEYDTSSWPFAHVQQTVTSFSHQIPNTQPPWFTPWLPPDGWPNIFTSIIAPRPQRSLAARTALFTRTWTPTATGLYHFWIAAASRIKRFMLNGIDIPGTENAPEVNAWIVPFTATVPLTAGIPVKIGIEVEKDALPSLAGFPGTLPAWQTQHILSGLVYFLPQGNRTVLTDSLIRLRTDGTWRVLDNPSEYPAPTHGRIVRQLVTEAQNRVALPSQLELGFDDDFDSNGEAWEPGREIAVRLTDRVWQYLAQSHSRGYSSRMRWAGLTLDCYNPGSEGAATGISLTGSNALVRLERHRREKRPNVLWVEWGGGPSFEVVDTAGVAADSRRIEASISLADLRDRSAAVATARAELTRIRAGGQSVQADTRPARTALGVAAYGGYRPLDRVELPGSEPAQVRRIWVREEDTSGRAVARPDLFSRSEMEADRVAAMLERGVPGTVDGQARTATPSRWPELGIVAGFVQRYPIAGFGQTTLVTEDENPERGVSTEDDFEAPVRLCWISMKLLRPPVSGWVVVEMRRDGGTLLQMFAGPGDFSTVWFAQQWTFRENQALNFALISKGEGDPAAFGLQVKVIAVYAAPERVRPTGRLPWV